MSNLSLSFSFYFWWINSSRSVTLTNTLSQTVNVFPDSPLWYSNRVAGLTVTTFARQTDDPHSSSAHQLSTNGIYTRITGTLVSSGQNIGTIFTIAKIDFTGKSTFKYQVKASGIGNYWCQIFATSVNDSDYTVDQGLTQAVITENVSEGIFSRDISTLSGEHYIGIWLSTNQSYGSTIPIIDFARMWLE